MEAATQQPSPVPTFDQMKEFLVQRYKHDRLYGRGDEYGNLVVRSAVEDLEQPGCRCISHHEAKSGEAIWYAFEDGEIVECDVRYDRDKRIFVRTDV